MLESQRTSLALSILLILFGFHTAHGQSPIQGRLYIDDAYEKVPDYGGNKTLGTRLTFKTGMLPRNAAYVVAIPEIQWNNMQSWHEVKCKPNGGFRRFYSYQYPNGGRVIARDIDKTASRQSEDLFVPDEVLEMEGSGEATLRYKIEFIDSNDRTFKVVREPGLKIDVQRQGGGYVFYRPIDPERKSNGIVPDVSDR